MPLINKILRMNGQAIQTPQQFHEHFTPGDFLRNKELAAYFALRCMEQVSPAHTYFSQLLNIAVIDVEALCGDCRLPPKSCIRSPGYVPEQMSEEKQGSQLPPQSCIRDPESVPEQMAEENQGCPLAEKLRHARDNSIHFSGHWFADLKAGVKGWSKNRNDALMTSLDQDPFRQKVRQQVQQTVSQTGLSGLQKFRLDLILSMGYLLAGWLPEERPISPAEAEAAFLGKVWTPEVTFRDTPEGRIYPARLEPYRLSLREDKYLPYGTAITLRKLTVECSVQGNTDMPAVFQLPDRQEVVMPGDYRYASFVGDEMIRLYPVEKRNGNRILHRKNGKLYLKDRNGVLLQEIPCEGQDIVDMIPAPKGEEWILLTPTHVDYRNFHTKTLPSGGIVELQMAGTTVYLLTEQGEVRRHGNPTGIFRRTTMDGMTL